MNQREKILAIVVGALLVLIGGYFVYTIYGEWVRDLENAVAVLETEISDKDAKIARGQFAAKRLKEFEARSLPGDAEVARSLYKAWLLQLAERDVRLATPIVTPGTINPATNNYKKLTFTVSGKGTLEQLARFLAKFYEADYLHQIRSLRVKPSLEDKSLEISLSVEALVLDGAAPANELAQRTSKRFDVRTAEDYISAIVNRNIFSPANRPPAIARLSSQRVEADQTLTVKVSATDPDADDKVTFRLGEGAPRGAQISASSGELTFRTQEKGSYQIPIVARDNGLPAKSAEAIVAVEVVEPKQVENVVRNVPPPETPKPRFDDAKFAYVTAIVEVAGERELWLTVRTSGELLKLRQGDKFEVERLQAVVERIGLSEIEVSSLGERRRFAIGDSLAEGAKIGATP